MVPGNGIYLGSFRRELRAAIWREGGSAAIEVKELNSTYAWRLRIALPSNRIKKITHSGKRAEQSIVSENVFRIARWDEKDDGDQTCQLPSK
jgi:hypothetical protein